MFWNKRGLWNKSGQFFLIAAIIIIMILFSLVVPYNTIKQTVALEDFKELSEGYSSEQPKVINLAIAEGKTGDEQANVLAHFTKQYGGFAQQREPSFGILYAYRDTTGNIHLLNSLTNKVINIQFTDPKTGERAELQLLSASTTTSGTVGLNIGGSLFSTTIETDVGNFGQQLSEADLEPLKQSQLQIVIKDSNGNIVSTIPINLEEFASTTYSSGDTCLVGNEHGCLATNRIIKAVITNS